MSLMLVLMMMSMTMRVLTSVQIGKRIGKHWPDWLPGPNLLWLVLYNANSENVGAVLAIILPKNFERVETEC